MSYDTLILARQTSTRNRSRNRNRNRLNPCKCQRQCPESRSGKRQTRKYMYGIKDPEEEVRKANDTKRNKTRRNEMKRTEPKCATEEPFFIFHISSSYSLYLIHYIAYLLSLGYLVFYISLCSRERNKKRLIEGRRRLCVHDVLQPSHLMRFISVFNSFVTLLCFCLHLPRSPSLSLSLRSTHN